MKTLAHANEVTGITNIIASASAPIMKNTFLLNEKSILNLVAIAVAPVSLSIHPFAISGTIIIFVIVILDTNSLLFIINIPIEYNIFPTPLSPKTMLLHHIHRL